VAWGLGGGLLLIDGEEGTRRGRCMSSSPRCRNVRGLFNLQQLSRARERPDETPNRCFYRPRPFLRQ